MEFPLQPDFEIISDQFGQLSEQFRRCSHLPAVDQGDGIAQALGTINATLLVQSENIAALQASMAVLNNGLAGLQDTVATLQDTMATLQGSVATLQGSVATLQGSVQRMETRMDTRLLDNYPSQVGEKTNDICGAVTITPRPASSMPRLRIVFTNSNRSGPWQRAKPSHASRRRLLGSMVCLVCIF